MANHTKSYLILLLNIVVTLFMVLFVTLRLHNNGVIDLNFQKNLQDQQKTTPKSKTKSEPPVQIPWRFHIEEDGFVFPRPQHSKEQFLTYEVTNDSWTKQIAQFENAIIFAYLLKRTFIVPPLTPFLSRNSSDNSTYPKYSMSKVIDFDLLSSVVSIKERDEDIMKKMQVSESYKVCHDPRLGFWVDYIPSVENIQTWRILREQYFTPVALNLQGVGRQFLCPGTEQYKDRWGPPLRVKPRYRGILTELAKRKEDVIYFEGDTLDTKHVRFFDQHRTRKAQELLLFYIRFSKEVTKKTKRLANVLGPGYNAILMDNRNSSMDIMAFIISEVERQKFNATSSSLFVVTTDSLKTNFNVLTKLGYNVIFADEFISNQGEFGKNNQFTKDESHLMSLLLCAYATGFVGVHTSGDLYFVEHLRLQDATMTDGLVTDKVSVRWARHTIKEKLDTKIIDVKLAKKEPEKVGDSHIAKKKANNVTLVGKAETKTDRRKTSTNKQERNAVPVKQTKPASIPIKKTKRLDKMNSVVCLFCQYIRYITGQHGCPTMKRICG